MNTHKAFLAVVVSIAAGLASADVAIGYREISGTNVASGSETFPGKLRMDESGTFLKTGEGELVVPAANMDASVPWSVDVLGGKVTLSGAAVTPSVPVSAPSAMQKARIWLDASNLAEGSLLSWPDCRANGYTAEARQLRADPVAPPVVTTVDGVRCVDFGGISDKYMRLRQNSTDTTVAGVQHWFFVYGFRNAGSPMLGCDSGYKWERGTGLLTTLGSDSVRYYDNSINSPYLYSGRADMVNRDIAARHWVDGVRIDPFSMRPKKGFQLFEADQQQSVQTFQTIFFKNSELFDSSTGRAGGNYVCEVVIFTVRLTEAERLDVERYLMAKWSLPRQKSVTGDEPKSARTGEIRLAQGTEAEVAVPASSESLPVTFGGKGDVVKSGTGTMVVGPSGARPLQGGFTLQGGDLLLRGGSMPAASVGAGEEWNSAVSPAGRQTTVAACAASGFRVTKTACSEAGTVVKSGAGEIAVGMVDAGVRKIMVNDGVLRLAAREGGADPDAGVTAGPVAIPNADFEELFDVGANQSRGLWDTTINSWHGLDAYYHTQLPSPIDTWTSYLTPCGDQVMMVIADDSGYCETDVTLPRAGTYELSLWATSRYNSDKRNCLDVKYNNKLIGHLQTTAGPYVKYRFRFDIAAEDAGASHKLRFTSRYAYSDSNTLIDGLAIRPVATRSASVVKVPNGDFNRRNRAEGDNGMKTVFSRALTHDGWTLSLTGDPAYTDEQNGYIAFCAGGCPADRVGYYPYQELGNGSGVLGFFGPYGRATTTAFTLPAGRWVLRGELAWWMTYLDAAPNGDYSAKPSVGAWIVRGAITTPLGTIATDSHSMGRFCWPTVIDVAADETVQIVVGNTNSGSGVLDNLEFVSAAVASEDGNLIPDPGCERTDKWVAYKDLSYYTRGDVERFSYADNVDAWGLDAFEGDYCLRLHNASGFYTPVTFPVAGLYRLTFHARPRPDSAIFSCNPIRVFLRLGDGSDLEIFRQKRMDLFWRYAEYTALFEIPAEKLPADGKLNLYIHGLGQEGDSADADRNTFVDGVSVVKVDPASVVMPTIPETAKIRVADGAQLHLDYPGTRTIAQLMVNGVRMPAGTVYSAANLPGVITGMGTLTISPTGFILSIR